MSFVGELSRRNVIRVSVAYAIVAWLVIQVSDIVLETIGAPDWVMQTLMLLLALGFVITVIFAWAYEVTPEGIRRESEVERTTSITQVTGRKLDRVIIGLLVVALGYFIWESRLAARPEVETTPATIVSTDSPDIEILQTPPADLSIAVLPFDNRSNQPDDEFFTEGMHDDLLTTLAKIGSMKVISRTSVMKYRDTTRTIPEIAGELGVAHILEGGVQRSGNQVRINVQLIDADTDEHLWAEIYDRELTAENLFAIQSEISKAIAEALHATLSPDEVRRLDTAPTKDLAAFDRYLRGRNLMATRTVEDLELATLEFLAAVEIDPQFALAWVGVADSHSLLASYGNTPRGSYFEIRDTAINKALEIDPRLGEAYASLGALLEGKGDLAAAEEAYKQAIGFSPNYATSYHWLSNGLRNNVLRLDEALAYARRAAELDPNSAIILSNLWGTYLVRGNFATARRLADQTLTMYPNFAHAYSTRARLLALEGDFAGAIEADRRAVELDADSPMRLYFHSGWHSSIGAFAEAREIARTLGERFPDHPLGDLADLWVSIAEGGRTDTRPIITRILEEEPPEFVAWLVGYAALTTEQFDLALQAFNHALFDDLASMEYDQEFLGSRTGELCYFSWLLLETPGAEERGRELLSSAIAFFENEFPDSIRYPERFDFDACYVLAGDLEKALDLLERQLENHFIIGWRWDLQRSLYDPLRVHPRFIELQGEYDALMAGQVAKLRRSKPAFEF